LLANVARLEEGLASKHLDGLIATTIENVYYFTGIDSVALRMFPHTEQCFALMNARGLNDVEFVSFMCELDQVLDAFPTVTRATGYGSFHRALRRGTALDEIEMRLKAIAVDGPVIPTALEGVARSLNDLGLASGRVGIDEEGVRPAFLVALKRQVPNVRFIRASGLLRWVRKIKTPLEVVRLAEAAHVAEAGIAAAVALMREGMTQGELVSEFNRTVSGLGASPRFALIRIGRSGVAGQASAGAKPLRRHDTVWFDVGCLHHGYWSDISRVASLDEPGEDVRRVYGALKAGADVAIEQARPGMSAGRLFELVVAEVRRTGLPLYQRHHVGHGIGLEAYDRPLLTPDNRELLEEGAVINVETPYYEFGLGALQIEDPILVGSTGNQLLTSSRRDITVVGQGH
jgi:Xaa-Pro aminopeptidase